MDRPQGSKVDHRQVGRAIMDRPQDSKVDRRQVRTVRITKVNFGKSSDLEDFWLIVHNRKVTMSQNNSFLMI